MRRLPPTCIALLVAATLADASDRPAWLWPVPLDRAVSSNFCEYRDGRFHAGLDVRTFGREGVPCLAVADGWISRVRVSSRGYGKALHLTLDSGEQVLYAHLAEFVPALEDTLRAVQDRDTTYTADFRPPPGRFRVHQGDVIAYSGSTGATAPHLHLEVRNADDAPVNPFLHGLAIEDRLRPQIARVVFVPLEAGATVDGRPVPLELKPHRVGDGRSALDDTLRIRGAVGLAAAVIDRVNTESGRLAPYELQVWADDSLIAHVTLGRIRFEQSAEVALLYHAGVLRARGIELFQMYARRGASTAAGRFVNGGALTATPGRVHAARFVAVDAAGNQSELSFIYMQDEGDSTERGGRTPGRGPLSVDLDGAFFHDDFAVIPLGNAGRLAPESERATDPVVVVQATDVPGRARPLGAYADRDTATVYVAGLLASHPARIEVPALRFALEAPAGSLYGDAIVFVRGVDVGDAAVELQRRSRAVRVGPAGLVVRSEMRVSIRVESADAKDAIYRLEGARSWSYMASVRDSTGVVTATSARPGVFAVLRDDVAPRLGDPRVRRVTSYATGAVVPEVVVPVDDAGSGFDESRLRVWVGGRRRVARWDFLDKKVVVSLTGEPIIGTQPVRVVAFDRIGNSSVLDTTIDIEAR